MLVVILSFVMYHIYKRLRILNLKNKTCECDIEAHDEIKSKSLICFPKLSKSSSVQEDKPKNTVKFEEKSRWKHVSCFGASKSPKKKGEVAMKDNVKKEGKEVASSSKEGIKQSKKDRVKRGDSQSSKGTATSVLIPPEKDKKKSKWLC